MAPLTIILSAIAGAALSSLLACIPGLHIYNVMGFLILGIHAWNLPIIPEILTPFSMGMIVGFAMLNTIPSILLAAPDESALFTVLPGQKFLMAGRGHEAVMIVSVGGLAGLFLLVLVVGPLAPMWLPLARAVFRPHQHWIIWCVIVFMLMSEWPKGGRLGQAGWRKFLAGWRSTGAGLLTFLLSGLLGFMLFFKSPISVAVSFQNLMPAFVGLFAVPWLALTIVSRVDIPTQHACEGRLPLGRRSFLWGTLAGGLGGGFAAFFPAITGGVGGFLAGHATALRDDRAFLVSQGASKLVYYVGGFLLFFAPRLHLNRGGAAWMLGGLYEPVGNRDYHMALASLAIAGCVSFLLIGPLTRAALLLITKVGYRRISSATLLMIVALVAAMTGGMGCLVMLVGAGIGLIPVLFGARRMNALGVILLPLACSMSGIGATIAGWLGLF